MALTTRSDFGRNLLDFCAVQRKRTPLLQLKGETNGNMTGQMGFNRNMVIHFDQHPH